MGAAGPLAAATFVFGPLTLILSIVIFLVGWSRIQLKVHNLAQVAAGILLAFISTYGQMILIFKWFK
jgi:membrane-associated phospholipid phosphatase